MNTNLRSLAKKKSEICWVGLEELLKFFRSGPWTMDSKAEGDRFTRFTRPTYINLLERCVELSTLLCGGARTQLVRTFSQPIDFSCGCDPVHATRTGAVRARGWVLLQSLLADSKLQADPSFWTESPIEKEEREITPYQTPRSFTESKRVGEKIT